MATTARTVAAGGLAGGLAGLAATQSQNLATALQEQRQSELAHLTQTALSIAREEYDAIARDKVAPDVAQKKAAEDQKKKPETPAVKDAPTAKEGAK